MSPRTKVNPSTVTPREIVLPHSDRIRTPDHLQSPDHAIAPTIDAIEGRAISAADQQIKIAMRRLSPRSLYSVAAAFEQQFEVCGYPWRMEGARVRRVIFTAIGWEIAKQVGGLLPYGQLVVSGVELAARIVDELQRGKGLTRDQIVAELRKLSPEERERAVLEIIDRDFRLDPQQRSKVGALVPDVVDNMFSALLAEAEDKAGHSEVRRLRALLAEQVGRAEHKKALVTVNQLLAFEPHNPDLLTVQRRCEQALGTNRGLLTGVAAVCAFIVAACSAFFYQRAFENSRPCVVYDRYTPSYCISREIATFPIVDYLPRIGLWALGGAAVGFLVAFLVVVPRRVRRSAAIRRGQTRRR
ncbi:hypothetical protein [Micromonospora sp. NPDC051141]|uniref:hypothetical protein n=1 Tax=Micromonospora sp. NPDC051141 TaxID=3364284 RepID=UPI0037BA15BC